MLAAFEEALNTYIKFVHPADLYQTKPILHGSVKYKSYYRNNYNN